MPKLVLTPRAEKSLEEISDYYVSEHSAERALKVIESIEEAFDRICDSPNSYPVCFDIAKPLANIRQRIVHNTFKVIYRVSMERIEVIEIFHGSRNPGLIRGINK